MTRIRTIKPEFPQSETIGKLSRDARLLFIQIWTIVDDAGRARASSRMLASLLYPYDDDAPALIPAWLDELERATCIRRYASDGSNYLDIPNWLKHQKIDKPSASRLPAFVEHSATTRECSRGVGDGPSILDLGPSTKESGLLPKNNSGKKTNGRGTCLPENWQPSESDLEYGRSLGLNDTSITHMAEEMRLWAQSNSNRAIARKADWNATFKGWMRRAKPQNVPPNSFPTAR